MKKRIMTLFLVFLIVSVAFAATGTTIVYITKTGAKYHGDGCASLKKSRIKVTLSEAVSRGYAPCKICNPPILTK